MTSSSWKGLSKIYEGACSLCCNEYEMTLVIKHFVNIAEPKGKPV